MNKKKAVFNWSGGKDSAHALLRIMEMKEYEIVALLTSINRETELSTMHNIPLALLHAQSESIGIPLVVVELKPKGNLSDYTDAIRNVALEFKRQGVTSFIYGDIFLHDVRKYREELLAPLGIETVEPLWGPSTDEIIEAYLTSGLKTVVVTTEDSGLGMDAIGKVIDRDFIENLPESCDPNGENGEYHTFCYDGPIFKHKIDFQLGNPKKESYDIKMDNGSIRTFTYCFANLQSV